MSVFDKKPGPVESDLQSDIIDFAEMRGWWCQKIVSQSARGIQDLLAIRHGRHVFIEVKKPGEEPTVQQAKRARDMRAHGATVYAVDNIEDARRILR
jgi:hypothetical protein